MPLDIVGLLAISRNDQFDNVFVPCADLGIPVGDGVLQRIGHSEVKKDLDSRASFLDCRGFDLRAFVGGDGKFNPLTFGMIEIVLQMVGTGEGQSRSMYRHPRRMTGKLIIDMDFEVISRVQLYQGFSLDSVVMTFRSPHTVNVVLRDGSSTNVSRNIIRSHDASSCPMPSCSFESAPA